MNCEEVREAMKPVISRLRSEIFMPDYQNKATDAEILGYVLSKYLEWNGTAILQACSTALEDSNYHSENALIREIICSQEPKELRIAHTGDIHYSATGIVYGKCWGGGEGAYPSITIEADNEEDLDKEIMFRLKEGSLDSGMGYESLIGALMVIETRRTVIVDDVEYNSFTIGSKFYGDLTDKQKEFLRGVE